jgi:butyryl-CoA dehydrogenase
MFDFDDDHRALQTAVRDFAFQAVAPGAAERDRKAALPAELLDQLRAMGLFGIAIPEEYGGSGMKCVASSLVVEEISKACAGTGVLLSAHTSLCVEPIQTFGTAEQKARFLPRMAT